MTADHRGGHLILMTRFPKASATSTTRSFNPLFFPLSTWTRALFYISPTFTPKQKKTCQGLLCLQVARSRPHKHKLILANVTGGLKTKANPERAALMRLMCVCVNKQQGGSARFTNTAEGSEFLREIFGRVKGKSQEKRDTSFPPFAPRTLTPAPIHRERKITLLS